MKFLIHTLGCQMNKNDSERMARILLDLGFSPTDQEDQADIILFNTCSVRQSAEERIYGKMKDMKSLKERNPKLIVGITGCMPGRDKKNEMRRRLQAVDLYFPTADMVHLPRWIAGLRHDLTGPETSVNDYLKIDPLRAASAEGFVTIQTGCNKYCAYCVVPYARGLERNRPMADILDEVRGLSGQGIVAVTLLGQSVNSYVPPDPETLSSGNPYKDGFAALLWEINQLPEVRRIHWTAAHPNSMTDEVIDAMALPKQTNYLHLPVQSGNDEVLTRMNRKYKREKFMDIIAKVKVRRPGIALGTDIIVGFPGETDEQFMDTVSLFKECDFDMSYHAQYSERSGTLASRLYTDDVHPDEKRRRWDVLQGLLIETSLRKHQAFVGQQVEVLVHGVNQGWASGTTSELKLARFPSTDATLVGMMVNIQVNQAQEWQLSGNLVC